MVSEKSLRIGIRKIWYQKSTSIGTYRKYLVLVSVSFKILGTVTDCHEDDVEEGNHDDDEEEDDNVEEGDDDDEEENRSGV